MSSVIGENREDPAGASHCYLEALCDAIHEMNIDSIEHLIRLVADVRQRSGRLFILGLGGSAANATHAAVDFRRLAQVEAYAPTDNTAELTALANDSGWDSMLTQMLVASNLGVKDMILVLSVGGGSIERNISTPLIHAVNYAKSMGASIGGIVGRDGGHVAQVADAVVIVPPTDARYITPLSESMQAVIWHLLVFHPSLNRSAPIW